MQARSATATTVKRSLATYTLDEELPGLPKGTPKASPAATTQVSKLGNGIKIASSDAGGSVAAVGVYVNAGARYEQVFGTAHFLSHLAFKRTHKRSSAKITRDIESFGGKFSSEFSRELITYKGEALRDSVKDIVGNLAETILEPVLRYWEVNEAKANFASLVASRPAPCQLQQELFGAAFGRASGIGHDPRASVYGLGSISDATLRSHLGANFNASSLVVVGSNVEHKAFHDLVESYLGNVPAAAPVATPASQFAGGYSEHRVDGETVSISVGFPADSLRASSPAFTVLSHVFGGHSGSFYGSRSLLKEELAKPENAFVKSLTFNHKALSDAGLIALTGKVAAKDADRLINLIASLFKTAAAGGISEDHLRRGVSSSVVDLYSFVDDKWKSNHYAGHHLLATGSAGDVSATGKALAGVTAADVASAVKTAIKGPVAVGAVGNTIYVPALPKIASKFA